MAAPEGGAPQLSELESLQLKANQITDESLDSTRRMIALCEESQAAGTKTLEMLDHQGEQLNRVEGDLDKMNAEMREADKHITGMEKWCGLCVCPWNRTSKVKDIDGTWKSSKSSDKEKILSSQPRNEAVPDSSRGPYIQKITNCAREDEMEDNMQQIGSVLGNLKAMASDMGNEIQSQNKQLDRINEKGENMNVKVESANTRTKKLIGDKK